VCGVDNTEVQNQVTRGGWVAGKYMAGKYMAELILLNVGGKRAAHASESPTPPTLRTSTTQINNASTSASSSTLKRSQYTAIYLIS
jgi:hypothetical protein